MTSYADIPKFKVKSRVDSCNHPEGWLQLEHLILLVVRRAVGDNWDQWAAPQIKFWFSCPV